MCRFQPPYVAAGSGSDKVTFLLVNTARTVHSSVGTVNSGTPNRYIDKLFGNRLGAPPQGQPKRERGCIYSPWCSVGEPSLFELIDRRVSRG